MSTTFGGDIGIGHTPLDGIHVRDDIRIQADTNAAYYTRHTIYGSTHEFASDGGDAVKYSITGGNSSTSGNHFSWWNQAGAATPVERFKIAKDGHITPGADNTQNFGSGSKRWANIYVGDMQLSNEGKEGGNEIDGTTGEWTIQEGDENLFVINRKTGKKFKMNLTEV